MAHREAEERNEALVGEEQGLLREQCRGTVCDKEEERAQRAGGPGLQGHGEGSHDSSGTRVPHFQATIRILCLQMEGPTTSILLSSVSDHSLEGPCVPPLDSDPQ